MKKWVTLITLLMMQNAVWAQSTSIQNLRQNLYRYEASIDPQAQNNPQMLNAAVDEMFLYITANYPESRWMDQSLYAEAENKAVYSFAAKMQTANTFFAQSNPSTSISKPSTLKSAWNWWRSTAPRNQYNPGAVPPGYVLPTAQNVYIMQPPTATLPVFTPNPGVSRY